MKKTQSILFGVLLAALDVVFLSLASFSAYGIREMIHPTLQPLSFYLPFFSVVIAIFLLCALATSLYDTSRPVFALSYSADFIRAYSLWLFFLVAFSFFSKDAYSRSVIVILAVLSFFFLYLLRILDYILIQKNVPHTQEVMSAIGNIPKLLASSEDPLALLISLRMTRNNPISQVAKRIFDIVLSLLALVPFLVLLPAIAILIRRDSEGPVFITQTRIGMNGKPFTLYKFRTMKITTQLYATAPRGENDPRVTNIGRTLRKYSLDELPQILNVLRGDMSLVGPRPEMPFIVEKYADWQKARLRVMPGITGLWQIFGRKDIPLEENLEYDLYYVFNQSFFLDLAIILQTIPHLIVPKGAY